MSRKSDAGDATTEAEPRSVPGVNPDVTTLCPYEQAIRVLADVYADALVRRYLAATAEGKEPV